MWNLGSVKDVTLHTVHQQNTVFPSDISLSSEWYATSESKDVSSIQDFELEIKSVGYNKMSTVEHPMLTI